MEKVRWRGTPGVGDFMWALNSSHKYAYNTGERVNLEMHWEHDEDYLHHPQDPETIIQRMEWMHTKYHRQDDVKITHVYNSDLFESGAFNNNQNKDRYYFDSEAYKPTGSPDNNWVFKKKEFVPKTKKIVMWTPHYNKESPRSWKRFLTSDDWYDIIKLLSWKGWILQELTYRTPIKEAYKHIQECDFIVCYDGMWHYIARNFAKPMYIPSWEGVTSYNTPNTIQLENGYNQYPDFLTAQPYAQQEVKDFFGTGGEDFVPNLNRMKNKAHEHMKRIERFWNED